MKPTRKLNRRSFMSRVAGGVAAGGALLLVSDEAGALAERLQRQRQRPEQRSGRERPQLRAERLHRQRQRPQ